MKNVCIVGYGGIGTTHAAALEKVQQAVLTAVCDIDEAARKRCLEKYTVAEYADFDTMLADESIHSVHICTPHYLHFIMIKKALAAGKYVVVEKPVTMTRREFDELLTLEGLDRVCVVFQNRYNVCVEAFRRIIESGELGEVKAARGIVTWYRTDQYYASADWRGKWATEGGGVLINQAIHTLDYFNYLAGGIASVQANMFNYSLQDVIEVEDTFTAAFRLKNGSRGIFFATNAYGRSPVPTFEIVFEKGSVLYTDKKLLVNGEVAAEDESLVVGKDYWGNGHEALLRHFYDEGSYFRVADAANTMETMFAMYDSAKHGGAERIVG